MEMGINIKDLMLYLVSKGYVSASLRDHFSAGELFYLILKVRNIAECLKL